MDDVQREDERRRRGGWKGIVAYVWYCGDDWCGCSMAAIDGQWVNALNPRFTWSERLWEGEFYTDHEAGASEELAAVQDAMVRLWPEAADAVRWPDFGRHFASESSNTVEEA